MGLILTSKTLDASDWALGIISPAVAINNLVYSGRYGSAEKSTLNLADYTEADVVGSPVHLGELVGTTFSNNKDYINTPITQTNEFTLLAIVSESFEHPSYAISNGRSISSTGFSLLANSSMYVPDTVDANKYKQIPLTVTDGFKVLVMRARTGYVEGQVAATIKNMTSEESNNFIPLVTGEALSGGNFRIGSAYSTVETSSTLLAAMGWNKWLTDTEIDEQYQFLKNEYPTLTF